MKPALPGGVGDQLIAQPAEDGVHQLRRSGRDSQARPGLVDVADGVAGAIAAHRKRGRVGRSWSPALVLD
jgi:hypothetical protein